MSQKIPSWKTAVSRGGEISLQGPEELIGSKEGDSADLRACMAPSYVGFPASQPVNSWRAPERAIPAPPSLRHGPFTELRLATSPAAVVFGRIVRRRIGSPSQSIRQLLRDRENVAIYRIEAPGVRVKDRRTDGRFAGGLLELRKRGELARLGPPGDGAAGVGWRVLEDCFEDSVAAVELPDDSTRHSLTVERSLVCSTRRLEALEADGLLKLIYVGPSRVGLIDLLGIRDVRSRCVGLRVAAFLLRELARDSFTLRGRVTFADWIKFSGALLSSLSVLYWLLSQILGR